MRLIDADAFIKYANNKLDLFVDELIGMINEQPTAFDIVQVLTDLSAEREYSYANFEEYVRETNPVLDAEYDDFFHRGLERAIKIVRKGGVE